MTNSAKPMTASEREALIAELNAAASRRPEDLTEHENNGRMRRAAAELSRLAAENERLRKIEARIMRDLCHGPQWHNGDGAPLVLMKDAQAYLRNVLQEGAADDA